MDSVSRFPEFKPSLRIVQRYELGNEGSPVDPEQKPFTEKTVSVLTISSIDDAKARENWAGRLDFLLSCIGFAVGLGNVWRFPYLCYKSGGGAFLIPYTFFLITCGLPLFFMEVSYGQFASLSPISVWRISPLFRGLGYGMVMISATVCIYYNVIMAWNFYFLYNSFSKVLPWTLCNQTWNTPQCVESTSEKMGNTSSVASSEFWELNVLEMTDGIEDLGSIRWPLFFALLLAWVIVFVCLFKGILSSGKVVYLTAPFPYFVLVILLVRGVTLPGAEEGIKFYVIPKWEKLKEITVWGDAAVQIFYSVGMAWGSLITMASYNKFNHNVYRDAMIVPLVNCGTSVFAGFVIFSTLGFMAHVSELPIEEVVAQGPGLAFVAYPEAVSNMPLSQLWAVLFFMMIFTVGVDSQFGMFETITSAFIDEYPRFLRKRKVLFTGVMCLVEFLLGIPFVTQGGIYVLQIVDWYSATFSLMIISVLECVVISWIYGIDRFLKDIELMTGSKPCWYWKMMWKYVTPSVVLFTWMFTVYTLKPASIKNYQFPPAAIWFGWFLGSLSLIPIPLEAINGIRKEKTGTIWQRVKKLSQPAYNWGPALEENKVKYIQSLSAKDRERFEASCFNMDREHYLSIRELDSDGNVVTITVDSGFDNIEGDDFVLPSEAFRYFSIASNNDLLRLSQTQTVSIGRDTPTPQVNSEPREWTTPGS